MSLNDAHLQLGWPSPDAILAPLGAGPAVYAELAKKKIQQALQRFQGGQGMRVGVLVRDSAANATDEPLAVVCDFRSSVPAGTLEEAHRLAWNFCRSKLLVIVEPHLVRVWTCCEPPPSSPPLGAHPAEVQCLTLAPDTPSLATQAAQSLHWLRLVSGDFVQSNPKRFRDEGRADRQLLDNLKVVRATLISDEHWTDNALLPDVAHDLLARIIFIQFLFDRKDLSGRPALGEQELSRLHERGILSTRYTKLGQILRNYTDAYRLFRWLNTKFNGDLFPGKGSTKTQREAEWRAEMQQVRPAHLHLLAQFVEGRLNLKGRSKQLYLWPLYAFDAIPLEFISSIYEVFVGPKTSVHYTPAYLVDFILDGILPWDGEDWNLRVLDPSCGSGIFLVKVFQRLVHRWRCAHPGEVPRAALLKRLLECNLFGIDLDEHAVRVASFSLYLAMCDEIDPRHYWNRMRFPQLRKRRLIPADFFDECKGFRTKQDAGRYDLVVGNVPWGQDSETDHARAWATTHEWPIVNKGVGTLFLAKAASLVKPDGIVAMITSASALLFNRETKASTFRNKLFEAYRFEEIINLSAVRFGIFANAKSAACIVVFQPTPPSGEPFAYICPKPLATGTPGDWLIIEPRDVQAVYPYEAASDPWVWTALLWGGRRDLDLVHRLARRSRLDMLGREVLHKRKGIVRGNRRKSEPAIVGRRLLETPTDGNLWVAGFPVGTFLRLIAHDLPLNKDPGTEGSSSTTMIPFELPQLIIKKSWIADPARFRAVMVDGDSKSSDGVVCNQSYLSVHVPHVHLSILEAACLSLNSIVAVYYLFLTSGRGASFIPEALVEEILSVPLPAERPGLLQGLETFDDVDARAKDAFGFNDAEWILIEDFVRHTVPQIQDAGSAGWRTFGGRDNDSCDEDLFAYSECFLRVLQGLGAQACASVFRRQGSGMLPVHLVAVYFYAHTTPHVRFEVGNEEELWSRLISLNDTFLKGRPAGTGGVFAQRTARIYDTASIDGTRVPVVYIVKPRALRYWTRAVALRDADEVVADAALWSGDTNHSGNEVQLG